MKKKPGLWVNIFLLLGGVVFVYFGYKGATSNASNWHSTPGSVVSSSDSMSISSGSSSNDYYLEVKYAYTAGGAVQTSSFTTRYGSQSEADDAVNSYAPGKEITVYYDPKDPGTSTLTPGEDSFDGYVALVFGVVLMGLGGWGLRPFLLK
jgi:hypothetical protein